jgi:hypothetical protein
MVSSTVKFKSAIGEKRFIQKVGMEVIRAGEEAAHVLKIMIFLHYAKDFQSVLKLYGVENCEDWMKNGKKATCFFDEGMMPVIHVPNGVWQKFCSELWFMDLLNYAACIGISIRQATRASKHLGVSSNSEK